MPRINRVTAVTWSGVTMTSVLSVDVDYNGNYNTSQGGGSLSMAATLRSVGGSVSVTYETAGAPANLDAAPQDMSITCKDDTDPTAGDITIVLPDMKPQGNAISIGDSGYARFVQKFQLAPGTGVATADMKPTVS